MSWKFKLGKWISKKWCDFDTDIINELHDNRVKKLRETISIAQAKTGDYVNRLDALSTAYETLEGKYNNVLDQRPRKTTPTTTGKKNQSNRKTNKKSTTKK